MAESDFRIEWAKGSDFEDILKVNESFFNAYSHDELFFKEGIAAGRVLIAHNGNHVAGYLIYQVLWGNTPFLALLRVLPNFRGHGIGKRMLVMCEEQLKKEGHRALISSSEAKNPDGNAFHVKMGFEKIGTVQMIYGDEVFYRKNF